MERLLSVSKELSDKIDSNEGAMNDLLRKSETLQQTVKAMIQYQSAVQEISGGEDQPRGPPRIEFSYIRQLQQDNSELRSLLEDHQAALDMIMTKYRNQMSSFVDIKSKEDSLIQEKLSEEVRLRTDQICEMATVMYHAAKTEDSSTQLLREKISQLEYENKYLREILSVPVSSPSVELAPVKYSSSETTSGHRSSASEREREGGESSSDDSRSSTPKPYSN
ncbi:PREDICTED: FGFR1 oncogene partner 2 homolog [Amphimedon queenslandica]|uniref:FGFR1 oncogene partner 2 homolog n=1 Tax=Amphimedon queenslandica TaxID=400682 RepID=A0A1X7UM39_AMPQE|nr:PREDICTED: FGFR1 oncogene partner 2 homolog [Amphimedon queenslandica]|eukprot:XP_003387498.1 PREDICTED: FGFR1 oncogene partner 2 homolog [Amphimedon queenslandica]